MRTDGMRLLITAAVIFIIAVNVFFSRHANINESEILKQLETSIVPRIVNSSSSSLHSLGSSIRDAEMNAYKAWSATGSKIYEAELDAYEALSKTFQMTGPVTTDAVEAPRPKIAYIFAGSARSFVCPKVHWSIRSHLIDSFGGDPYVFIRVSEDDNKNIKTGTGVVWKQKYGENELNETLKVLNPKVVEYFAFANQIEDMKKNYPGMDHKVFREMDTRRYSMYFHRCMAYKLMLRYELEQAIQFDWVILVRLDASWLEPQLPIESYANDRVWITETGFDLFNDQFMLVPRQFSDYLYDLNTKVHKNVYCLGGPDVEKWKCKADALTERGVTGDMQKEVLSRCCADRLQGHGDKQGYSERIHMKHLRAGNIPLGLGRFPVFLTRRAADGKCNSECFRIFTYHYKEYVYRFGARLYANLMDPIWPDTRARSISARDKQVCSLIEHYAGFAWQPLSALQLHQTGQVVDYSQSLYDQQATLPPSLLLNPKDTEWWRILPTYNVDGCMTMNYEDYSLTWTFCHDHSLKHNLLYDTAQLFQLYVLPHRTGEFESYYARGGSSELTLQSLVNAPYGTASTPLSLQTNSSLIYTRVVAPTSQPRTHVIASSTVCLTVAHVTREGMKVANTVMHAKVRMAECLDDVMDPTQLFVAVKGWTDGSRHMSTVGSLALAQHPTLCVTRSDNKEMSADLQAYVPQDDLLYIGLCDYGGNMHRVRFEFEFIRS